MSVGRAGAAVMLAGTLLVAGCRPATDREVLVFAASSLTDVAEAFADAYARRHPGVTVMISPGASSTLARQIVAGAPAEVFLSADPGWVDALAVPDRVGRETVVLAHNQLVVVGPPGRERWADLGGFDRVARIGVGDPAYVPVGRYAREALGARWASLEPRLIPMADARAVLAAAGAGTVDAAIVYASDTLAAPDLTVLYVFAPGPSIDLVGVALPDASQAARDWLASLHGPEAGAVWRRYGFQPAAP